MSSAVQELLADLKELKIGLGLNGDNLKIRAEKGVITQKIKESLVANKTALIEYLKKESSQLQSNSVIQLQKCEGDSPLSFTQQRLWFLDILEGSSATFNIAAAFELEGRVDEKAFRESFKQIITRHDSLRMRFPSTQAQASIEFTEVYNPLEVIHCEDEEVESLIHEFASRVFDLSRGELFRAKLLKVTESRSVLILNMHHIISDGWSVGILFREFVQAYSSLLKGLDPQFSPLDFQYQDYSFCQKKWLESESFQNQLNYWKGQLAGVPEFLELSLDHPRPAIHAYQGTRFKVVIPQEVSAEVNRLSREHGCTLFMTLLSVFNLVLYRHSGQSDFCVGSPIANRNNSHCEDIIGFFVNMLVLRTQIDGSQSFSKYLEECKKTCLDAYDHQDVPLELLIDTLQPERSLSHNPLFQVMFALQNSPMKKMELPNLKLNALELNNRVAKFDLTLDVTEVDGCLECDWEYNTAIFDLDTIQTISTHFNHLLNGVVTQPECAIAHLPMLSQDELSQYAKWNSTEAPISKKPFFSSFEVLAESMAHKKALVYQGESLSYSELNDRSNQLASYLLKLKDSSGQAILEQQGALVGICLDRSLEMIVSLLGVLKSGATYVPLDPSFPVDRINYMLEDSALRVLISRQEITETLSVHEDTQLITFANDGEAMAQEPSANLNIDIQPEDPAYIIYTSGSTGLPKGVQIPHRALTNFISSMAKEPGMKSDDITLALTTVSFDMAVLELYLTLVSGATLIIAPREVAVDGQAVSEMLESTQATFLQATPVTWQMLLSVGWKPSKRVKMLTGGEAISKTLASQLIENEDELWNMYGPTETTVWSTVHRIQVHRPNTRESNESIGRPIDNTTITILNSDLQIAPLGVAGELYIGGEGLATGYFKREELTLEKFIFVTVNSKTGIVRRVDRNSPNAIRLYNTGDFARWLKDGNLECLGRSDNQVKISGYRIELGEIETRLEEHESVSAACVTAQKVGGSDFYTLAAYLICSSKIDIEKLRNHLSQDLPTYMIPAHYIPMDEFPLTNNRKLDRKALPSIESSAVDLGTEYIAPRNEAEEKLAQAWQEILSKDRIGIHDNYFSLGGDSIKTIQVSARVLELGYRLNIQNIFSYPTIAELAHTLVSTENDSSLQKKSFALSPPQLNLLERHESSIELLSHTLVVKLHQKVDLARLKKNVEILFGRHEILNSRIQVSSKQQRLSPWSPDDCSILELTDLQDSNKNEVLVSSTLNSMRSSFNLEKGPLLKLAYLKSESGTKLLIVAHALLLDPQSMGIFIQDLSALCFERKLEAKETSYLAWAKNLSKNFAEGEETEVASYWEKIKSQKINPIRSDFYEVDQLTSRSETLRVPLELGDELQGSSGEKINAAYRTESAELLLAVFMLALKDWQNINSLLIDLESGSRNALENQNELARTCGVFSLTHPFLLSLPEEDDLASVIKWIKESYREVSLAAFAKKEIMPCPSVSFRVLAPLKTESTKDLFEIQSYSTSVKHSPENDPSRDFEFLADLAEGRLKLSLSYSKALFEDSSIRKFLEIYARRYKELIAHCENPSSSGLTPSDIDFDGLDMNELDDVLEGL